MKQYELTATVLGRRNFGEADRIYTILSRERGLVRAKARGVRKIRAKLAAHLEPFALTKLRLAVGKSLDVIIGASVVRAYRLTEISYEAVEAGFVLILISSKLLYESGDAAANFDLLLGCFEALEADVPPYLVEHYFCYKTLDLIGSLPDFSLDLGRRFFDLDQGKLVADKSGVNVVALDDKTAKLWHLMRSAELSDLARVVGIEQIVANAQPILLSFYKYHFDIEFERQNPL